jgi:cysteine desulfurase
MDKNMKDLYFDGAADTPLSKKVFRAMKPFMTKGWVGNAHSVHEYGRRASIALEKARTECLTACGFGPFDYCVFTSGATEGLNWAIKSLLSQKEEWVTVVPSIEHSSVLVPIINCEKGERQRVLFLEPNPRSNRIDVQSACVLVQELCTRGQNQIDLLVISPVNNETGAINDVNGVYEELTRKGIVVRSAVLDCTQSLSGGDLSVKLGALYPSYDYFVLGSHKIGGPEGCGIVFERKKRLPFPLIEGGSQENGQRAGTSNVPGAVGTAAALKEMAQSCQFGFYGLRQELIEGLKGLDRLLVVNESVVQSPNIASITFSEPFLRAVFPWHGGEWDGDDLVQCLDRTYHISVSAGAACSAGDDSYGPKPSHVLRAFGLGEHAISRTVRFSFTVRTKPSEIKEVIKRLGAAYRKGMKNNG